MSASYVDDCLLLCWYSDASLFYSVIWEYLLIEHPWAHEELDPGVEAECFSKPRPFIIPSRSSKGKSIFQFYFQVDIHDLSFSDKHSLIHGYSTLTYDFRPGVLAEYG